MLTVIGLAAAIVAAYFAYKTANENGRNGVLWLFATLTVGFGLQLMAPLFIGIIAGIAIVATGSSIERAYQWLDDFAMPLGIILLLLSFVGMWLILRHVSRLPEDTPGNDLPPPPRFDQE
jgi:uncharacterized membrane protein